MVFNRFDPQPNFSILFTKAVRITNLNSQFTYNYNTTDKDKLRSKWKPYRFNSWTMNSDIFALFFKRIFLIIFFFDVEIAVPFPLNHDDRLNFEQYKLFYNYINLKLIQSPIRSIFSIKSIKMLIFI